MKNKSKIKLILNFLLINLLISSSIVPGAFADDGVPLSYSASKIKLTPSGSIAATNVQNGIMELDSEKVSSASLSALVRAITLSGLSLSNSALTSSDSILSGFGKVQGQIDALSLSAGVSSVNGLSGAVSLNTSNINDSTDKRYVTDAQKTVIQNTIGINSGDQDLSGYVQTSRTVNGHALSSNINVTETDILPSYSGNSGKYLTNNGSASSWATITIPTFDSLSAMTTLGDLIYGGASGTGTRLSGNTTATKKFLNQTGNGAVSAAPSWGTITLSDLPTITETSGGTNQTSYTTGDILYSSASNTLSKLSGNTTATKKFLTQTGNGANSAAPSWSQPAASDLSDGTTGSGNIVLATSPSLVTPALGTPSSGVATNLTGTASGLTAGNVTTNANLTGPITSVGNATAIASQTGTGTKFVVDTSPTLVTPVLGVATATTINTLKPGGLLVANNSTITITSNSETSLLNNTYSFLANTAVTSPTYTTLRYHFVGAVSTSASPGTWTFKIKLGGSAIATAGGGTASASLSGRQITLDGEITFRTLGSSGTVIGQNYFNYNSSASAQGRIEGIQASTTTLNTTTNLTIDASWSWGTNAVNTLVIYQGYVELI